MFVKIWIHLNFVFISWSEEAWLATRHYVYSDVTVGGGAKMDEFVRDDLIITQVNQVSYYFKQFSELGQYSSYLYVDVTDCV